ncbi:MAG: hypothetical protein WAS54_00745 [Scrofimicrobium sp.]
MTQSLRVSQSVRRLTSGLAWAAIGFVVAAILLGLLLPSHPWSSVLVGLVLSLAMFGVSLATTRAAAKTESLSVGPIALDYVVKIALVAGGLIAAQNLDGLEVKVVGLIVAASVLVGTIVQLWAFTTSGRRSDDSDTFA